MVAGRYHWKGVDAKPARKTDLLAFHFAHGTLLMAEAGARKRASLHIVHGEAALAAFDLSGLEPMDCTEDSFRVRLTNESHTLKRALTDPRMMSGIGNGYSDEILHAARLSSFRLASKLNYPRCQLDRTILRDRAFSRLLNKDWPKTIEELEAHAVLSRMGGDSRRGDA